MQNCKKLLSIFAALTLFVSLVLPAGIIPATAAANDLIAYVNTTSGNNDTAQIGDSSKPYATIAAAVTAIDAVETDGERIVQFVGASDAELPEHTNMITIRGVNTTDSTITIRNFGIHGPTKLENFDLTTNEAYINTNYHELILGEGFTASRWAYVMTGGRWGGSSASKGTEKITVNDGDVYWLYVGSPNRDSNNNYQDAEYNRCDGLDYVFNDGSMIGAAIGYHGAVDIRGNINITMSKPLHTNNYSGIYLYSSMGGKYTKFNGNALQLIYNNNSKDANATKSGSNYPTVASIAAIGGKFYELVVDKNDAGSTLSTTDVAGTYELNDAAGYIAVAYNANGEEVARSNKEGYLTVLSEGAYTVKWEEIPNPTVWAVDLSETKIFYTGHIEGKGSPVYRAPSVDDVYVVSFDYYIPETPSFPMKFSSTNDPGEATADTAILAAGRNSFYGEFTTLKGVFTPHIERQTNEVTEIYIWNYSVKVNGNVISTTTEEAYTSAPYNKENKLSSYVWASDEGDKIPVTEITFGDSSNEWGRGHYTAGVDENTLYELSFDYYVPASCDDLTVRCATSQSPTTVEGSLAMKKTPGHHTFSWKGYNGSAGKFYPRIRGTAGQKLYIWNYKFTVGGHTILAKNRDEAPGTAVSDGVGFLCNQSWYSTMDDSVPMSMTIATPPTKTVYELGDSLDTAGLTLSLLDNYDRTITITEGFEVSGFDPETAGEQTVTVSFAGLTATFKVTVNEPALMGDGIAYVDINNGNDETAKIGFSDRPFATIAAAVTAIDAVEMDGERIVQFVGASSESLPAHTNMITIRGVNTTDSTITVTNFSINGPTKLENFDLTTGEAYINTNYHELILGEGFTASRWAYVMTGGRWGGSSASKGTEKITVNDGDVYWLYVGSPNRDSNNIYQDAEHNRCDGLDYVFNDGSMIGAAIGYHGAVDIRGNINITMSKPLYANNYSGIYLYSSKGDKYTKFNGNALQLIYNNNSKDANATKSGSNYPTVASIAALGGKFYELVVDQNDLGSTLSATETAGVYKLNNNGELIAIAYDADGKQVARSKDGYLTVEEAGSYTVVWAEEKIEYASTLYVSENGSDAKSTTGTQDDPFQTINAAITALNTVSADNKTIYILDTATLPEELTANLGEITITGAAEAQLLMANDVVLNGDIVFGGVMQDHTASNPQFSFRANGHNISFRGGMQQTANYPKIPEVFLGKTNTNLGKITMTIDDAAFNRIYTGAYYNTKDVTIDGTDIFFNSGSAYSFYLGANGWSGAPGTTTYTDNVNLVFNGGFVRNNLIQIINIAAQNRYTAFADGAALQVIFNDGKGTTMMVVDSSDTSTPYVADNFYRIECAADVFLTPTAVAGEYTVDVPTGKYAIAKKNGNIVGYAADGETLSVDGAGTYKVEYTDNVNFFLSEDTESGEVTLTVNEDFTMDFETFEILEREGYIFNGWVDEDGNVLTDPNLTAGTVIKANYVAKDERFYMVGTQIREAKGDKEQALRFIVHLGKDFGVNVLERGTLVIPNTILGVKELVIGGTYSYNGNTYSAQTVVGEKLWVSADGYMRYTAALTGITNYMTAYAVRGYIRYVDMNGVERTEYTDNTTAASMNEVAEQLLELDPDDATAKAIVEAAKAAVEQKYASTAKPLTSSMFNNPNSGYTTLNSDIKNGKYTTSNGEIVTFTKLDGKLSPLVIDVDVDAVGENSNVDATTIMQLSDIHFTYCDEDDFAENNPLTMASWEHRQNNGTWFTTDMDFSSTPVKWVENTLQYAAAVGDQTVITGDIIDFLSYGSLKLMNRVIAEPYSNSLMVVGNHEPVRLVSDYGVGADDRFCAEYYDLLEKYWVDHDLSYTSKMVGKEVMVIQMDNADYYFTQAQVDKLTADLAIARENGYTVLIFTHIPFVPTDGATSQELLMGKGGFEDGLVASINSNIDLIDGRDADWSADGKSSFTAKEHVASTEAMYDLIVGSSDVVKGLFNGHMHSTVYSKLYTDGGEVIPQYTLGTSFIEGGVTLKINVK